MAVGIGVADGRVMLVQSQDGEAALLVSAQRMCGMLEQQQDTVESAHVRQGLN